MQYDERYRRPNPGETDQTDPQQPQYAPPLTDPVRATPPTIDEPGLGQTPIYAPPLSPPGVPVHPSQQDGATRDWYGDAPLIHPGAARMSEVTPYGVPVYRAPYGYAPPMPSRPLSITAFVVGLCSAFFAWLFVVPPIVGLVFGILGLRREPAGRGFAITGIISSAVGITLIALVYVLPLLLVFLAAAFSGWAS